MVRILGGLFVIFSCAVLAGDKSPAEQQERLAKLQSLVGSWRGVAQPQHGSARDSWIEHADWSWDFLQSAPALIATLPQGKYFSRFRLTSSGNDEYRLAAKPSNDGAELSYAGRLNDQNHLVLLAEQPRKDFPRRITFRFVAGGDRQLLLMEKQGAAANSFLRLAEIGYTRSGSGFGKDTASGRECIVTGGVGTIEVAHNGKTYYVCCTGCRDYFVANPEQVLAEYAAKKKSK